MSKLGVAVEKSVCNENGKIIYYKVLVVISPPPGEVFKDCPV
jgi:hypothetical protein